MQVMDRNPYQSPQPIVDQLIADSVEDDARVPLMVLLSAIAGVTTLLVATLGIAVLVVALALLWLSR
jgi:hypothetical protein